REEGREVSVIRSSAIVSTGGPCSRRVEAFSSRESLSVLECAVGIEGTLLSGGGGVGDVSVGTTELLLRRKSCHDSLTGGVPIRGLMLFESVYELEVDVVVVLAPVLGTGGGM